VPQVTRRHLIQSAALASGALALGPAFWQRAVASAATPGDGPYGPLGPPDANGIRLPEGFKARVIARGGEPVQGTTYSFPLQPDGQATFATQDGGWILVTNSEVPLAGGGVSATRFSPTGEITDAYRILGGTQLNCAGGPTPWGTWLSGEEYDTGQVWECDPTQASQGVARPALGNFKHEAVAVDSAGQRLYLTEDFVDGNLYRFTPESYPELDAGVLEVASVAADGKVSWLPVPNPNPGNSDTPTRKQVPEATVFARAEGIWFDSGMVYVATTADEKIHAYDTIGERVEVIYDRAKIANAPLQMPDNLSVSPSGDLFVAENHDAEDGHLDVMLLTPDLVIAPFLSVEGGKHIYDNPILGPSELTGPVFDPSGTRFYFTSQRARPAAIGGSAPGPGEVYEVTGPFRLERPRSGPLSPGNPREAGQAIGSGQGRSPGARLVGPALGIEVPRRIGWRKLRRRGLPVAMTVDGPAEVEITVRGRFVAASQRGPGARRRSYRLARAERTLGNDGPQVIRVKLTKRSYRRLRGRRTPLRMKVKVTVGDDSVTRTTILGRPPRGGRRRRR
jgi:secreted PhoX family phosphatase